MSEIKRYRKKYMLSIDIDAAVQEKLAFNTTRGHKHGKTI